MNIFSVGDGGEYDLTRENYIAKTHKRFPFYQNPKRYQNPYFAICPACNNPIQIINLFGEQYEEEQTGNTTMHGRHFIRSVDGLPLYNRENYDACPIHNPIAFRIRRIRENEPINEEIRELVENNRNKIAIDIRKITGILLKNEGINRKVDGPYSDEISFDYQVGNVCIKMFSFKGKNLKRVIGNARQWSFVADELGTQKKCYLYMI